MTILVTGATGNVGRLVVDELVRAGAPAVRALTVDPEQAALPPQVEVVTGYLGRPSTLPAALAGIDTVYLAPLPRTVRAFTALARRAGVRRVVTLSSSSVDEEAAGDPAQWHYYAVEQAVEQAGFAWTHLRPGSFMTNTLGWADSIRREGVVRWPYPGASETPIDLRDIAAVAAVVLLDERHTGQSYTLTGPQSIRQIDQVRAIGAAIGKEIRFEELTPEQARQAWRGTVPEAAIAWLLDGYALSTAQPQVPLPTVQELTGRPARTFAQWAIDHAHLFL
ncbi:MAG TPA: NAD(P)H-binding protein [Chloroflexota bacterium]|nr:NAD(P)H-binding protein [Chloroflexota bacterium]